MTDYNWAERKAARDAAEARIAEHEGFVAVPEPEPEEAVDEYAARWEELRDRQPQRLRSAGACKRGCCWTPFGVCATAKNGGCWCHYATEDEDQVTETKATAEQSQDAVVIVGDNGVRYLVTSTGPGEDDVKIRRAA